MYWRDAEPSDYAVIGDPIAHSLSPRIHSAAYRTLGRKHSYRAIQVPADELTEALEHLAALGCLGCNATLPHKLEAIKWAEPQQEPGMTPAVGANTINLQKRTCISTDEEGFMRTLPLGIEKRALVLGAGGAGRALATRLDADGWELRLWNRTTGRWKDGREMEDADPAGCGLILNATSAGHAGQEPPVLWDRAPEHTLAYDVSYGPAAAGFLASAESRQFRTQDGLAMLVEQAALSLEWWLGRPAPREVMRAAVGLAPDAVS